MTPTDAIKSALDNMTALNTKDEVAVAILAALRDEGFRIVDCWGDEPYIPNEYTIRIPVNVWRKLNQG